MEKMASRPTRTKSCSSPIIKGSKIEKMIRTNWTECASRKRLWVGFPINMEACGLRLPQIVGSIRSVLVKKFWAMKKIQNRSKCWQMVSRNHFQQILHRMMDPWASSRTAGALSWSRIVQLRKATQRLWAEAISIRIFRMSQNKYWIY